VPVLGERDPSTGCAKKKDEVDLVAAADTVGLFLPRCLDLSEPKATVGVARAQTAGDFHAALYNHARGAKAG